MKKFSSTTKGSFRRTSSTHKQLQRIVGVALVALVLFYTVPQVVARIFSLATAPLYSVTTWVQQSSASFPRYLRDRAALSSQIDTLEQQLAEQLGSQVTVRQLQNENESLRLLLGASTEERILAGVIGRPNALPYDTIMLDQGSEDGVVEGAPVYIGNNTVIGAGLRTFPHTALVELVTTPGAETSVYIVGPNIYTTAMGMGGGQLRVGVPQGIRLEEGDSVILPSISAGVYGTINHIESEPTRPEQYGYVTPEVPLASLRLVAVGQEPLTPVSFEEAQAIVAETKAAYFSVPVPEGVLVDIAGTTSASTTEAASNATTTP